MTRQRHIKEAGGSGYSAAFTHPDPLDPNDRVRQKTQARADSYPYDSPVSYGAPVGTDMGGAAYQRAPDQSPPVPRSKKASDQMPYGEYGVAWEQLESMLDPYSPGDQADDAISLGYGQHGRMGEDEVDIDALRSLFQRMSPAPSGIRPKPRGLMAVLMPPPTELVDPDDRCGDDLYSDWGHRIYAPGAEDDPI